MALKKFCRKPGCTKLTTTSYCEDHPPNTYDKQRGTAAERGYDHKWRKARVAFLQQHPLCRYCKDEGELTAATVIDHIVPHRGDKKLFWDRKNWQPLCESCHNRKTAKEDGGFGNQKSRS